MVFIKPLDVIGVNGLGEPKESEQVTGKRWTIVSVHVICLSSRPSNGFSLGFASPQTSTINLIVEITQDHHYDGVDPAPSIPTSVPKWNTRKITYIWGSYISFKGYYPTSIMCFGFILSQYFYGSTSIFLSIFYFSLLQIPIISPLFPLYLAFSPFNRPWSWCLRVTTMEVVEVCWERRETIVVRSRKKLGGCYWKKKEKILLANW